MAVMVGNLNQAMLDCGASAAAAEKAAEEVADHQKPLADLRTDVAVVKAMLAIIIAGAATLILKGFFG